MDFKTVIVPTDFSEEAQRAVDRALTLVKDPRHVTVVHVGQSAVASEGDLMLGLEVPSQESRTEQLYDILRKKFSDQRYEHVNFQVLFGSPATEIAKFAESEHADLIVLPSHGRTGLARLMIGSVAERVVRLAHCPVLVLRQ